jgi:hypothetical protein
MRLSKYQSGFTTDKIAAPAPLRIASTSSGAPCCSAAGEVENPAGHGNADTFA